MKDRLSEKVVKLLKENKMLKEALADSRGTVKFLDGVIEENIADNSGRKDLIAYDVGEFLADMFTADSFIVENSAGYNRVIVRSTEIDPEEHKLVFLLNLDIIDRDKQKTLAEVFRKEPSLSEFFAYTFGIEFDIHEIYEEDYCLIEVRLPKQVNTIQTVIDTLTDKKYFTLSSSFRIGKNKIKKVSI